MQNSLTKEFLQESNKRYEKNPLNKVVRHALTNGSITNIARSQDELKDNNFDFSINIPTQKCPNQKNSGRCWIFAGLNVLREIICKQCNLKDFELSQSYVAFYDKLEKINYKLESIISLLGNNPDERVFSFVLNGGIEDGGQWDMFVNVVKKYGIVPKTVLDETFQSSNTRELNSLINVELKKFAASAQSLYKQNNMDAVYTLKNELLEKFYHLLLNAYGKQIDKFNFEYTDKDGNYHLEKDYTPLSFFEKYIGSTIDEYVSLINSPTQDKPYYETYTIDYLGNVVGGKDILHLNLPIERFKELALTQLTNKEVVWFGCDCGKYADRMLSIWDIDAYDYQTPFGLDYKETKENALNYGISAMDHAMVFTGVNVIDGKTTKWKVENSWGTDKPNCGYYIMTDAWFEMYVYQLVINKKYLNEKELACYEKTVNVLKPWDPMGTLAK